jgi:cholesterol 7-dehydrogenase
VWSAVQEIPENAGDVAHLNAIHAPSMLAGSDLRYIWSLLHGFARHVWSAKWQPSADVPHQSIMHLHHELRLFNKVPVIVMDVEAKQVCMKEQLILNKCKILCTCTKI